MFTFFSPMLQKLPVPVASNIFNILVKVFLKSKVHVSLMTSLESQILVNQFSEIKTRLVLVKITTLFLANRNQSTSFIILGTQIHRWTKFNFGAKLWMGVCFDWWLIEPFNASTLACLPQFDTISDSIQPTQFGKWPLYRSILHQIHYPFFLALGTSKRTYPAILSSKLAKKESSSSSDIIALI